MARGDRPLLLWRDPGDATGADHAPIGDERAQQRAVLVVDVSYVGGQQELLPGLGGPALGGPGRVRLTRRRQCALRRGATNSDAGTVWISPSPVSRSASADRETGLCRQRRTRATRCRHRSRDVDTARLEAPHRWCPLSVSLGGWGQKVFATSRACSLASSRAASRSPVSPGCMRISLMSVIPLQLSQSLKKVDWKSTPNAGPSSGAHT